MRLKTIFVISGLALGASLGGAQSKAPAKSSAKPAAKAKAAAPRVSVQAPWRLVYNDTQLLVTIDTSQVEKMPDGSFRSKMRWLYQTDQKIEGNKTYRQMLETRLLDCKKVRSKPISATVYDADGNRVTEFSTPEDELPYLLWGKRVEGSRNDNALIKACEILVKIR